MGTGLVSRKVLFSYECQIKYKSWYFGRQGKFPLITSILSNFHFHHSMSLPMLLRIKRKAPPDWIFFYYFLSYQSPHCPTNFPIQVQSTELCDKNLRNQRVERVLFYHYINLLVCKKNRDQTLWRGRTNKPSIWTGRYQPKWEWYKKMKAMIIACWNIISNICERQCGCFIYNHICHKEVIWDYPFSPHSYCSMIWEDKNSNCCLHFSYILTLLTPIETM